MKSTNRCTATDICRLSLMWEVPTVPSNLVAFYLNTQFHIKEIVRTSYLIRSTGLWRWFINITIIILDIIHRPVFYLKQNVSETGFCLLLQVEPNRVVPIEKDSLCHRKQRLAFYWEKTETESSLRYTVFEIKDRTMNNVQKCDSYFHISYLLLCILLKAQDLALFWGIGFVN
jgi:hypothetical protein